MTEPRSEAEYGRRQSEAARRVLIDVGQVLASFSDCLVVVGGWTPDLLFQDAGSSHVGSLDSGLPRAYTPELYTQKCSALFEHIYEAYPGNP